MAKKVQSIALTGEAGFLGMNSELDPYDMPPGFAKKMQDFVFDGPTRIVSIPQVYAGTQDTHTVGRMLNCQWSDGTDSLIYVGVAGAGGVRLYDWGRNSTASTDLSTTGTGLTINGSLCQLGDVVYLFAMSNGFNEPVCYDYSTTTHSTIVTHASAAGSPPRADIAISAFGRVWAARTNTDSSTIYWSDSLLGMVWTGGTSGSINVSTAWVNGQDQIMGLAEHGGNLIVFGTRQILIFSGADDSPGSNLALYDSISGVGLADKDTIKPVGGDLIFLSTRGLISLGRAIQEKSLPLVTLDNSIKDELAAVINIEYFTRSSFHAAYDSFTGYYFLIVHSQHTSPGMIRTFVFDTRHPLPDGSWRVSEMMDVAYSCGAVTSTGVAIGRNRNVFVLGSKTTKNTGVNQWWDWNSGGAAVDPIYETWPMYMGAPDTVKMVKSVTVAHESPSDLDLVVSLSVDEGDTYASTTVDTGTVTGTTDQIRSRLPFGGAGYGVSAKIAPDMTGQSNNEQFTLKHCSIQLITGRTN